MIKTKIENPELFFCLVAPVGVDLDTVYHALESELKRYSYQVRQIRVTDAVWPLTKTAKPKFSSLSEQYDTIIKLSNALRKDFGYDVMASLALMQIQSERTILTGDAEKPAEKIAYIIRQFKRPEEIRLFREIYGKQAFQVSCYAPRDSRISFLSNRMKDYDNSATRSTQFDIQSITLLERDENEDTVPHGQRVRDAFPLADIFIDATSSQSTNSTISRFIKILYGYNFHSPTRDEYGMYIAKSASLRSVDLSRQVGAAIFSERGEVKTLGCNEVPSPKGGTFWEGDAGDSREFTRHADTNDEFKHRLLGNILSTFSKAGLIDKKYADMKPRDFLSLMNSEKNINISKSLMMMDIIEYGRIIHAEMNAITDAARKGVKIEGDTLYCTTFPCHLCAKHIISSGIKRVVYIEPYPKSYTQELYAGEIILSRTDFVVDGKVYFEPLIGVAPYRYRDFFEKGKRKNDDGSTAEWHDGMPLPLVEVNSFEYIGSETSYLKVLIDKFREKNVLIAYNITQ